MRQRKGKALDPLPPETGTALANSPPADQPPRQRTPEEAKVRSARLARISTSGQLTAVQIAHIYGGPMATESLPVGDLSDALSDMVVQIGKGNMASVERMLISQAVALNVMFGEFARRASKNMGEHLDATESYTRMALKAQAQSANTLRILAEVKNPKAPVAFVKQANITSGNQQVNNGPAMQGAAPTATSTHAHARTGENPVTTNELLVDGTHGTTKLDFGTAGGAGCENPAMAALGAVHRAGD
jgi:hypothetical protein